jgi:glycosyltransferase involved in cell wall biosynthesis
MDSALRLSVAIPVHNEKSVLPELLRRTCPALDQVPGGGRHEIVFVDDGSTDRTFATSAAPSVKLTQAGALP